MLASEKVCTLCVQWCPWTVKTQQPTELWKYTHLHGRNQRMGEVGGGGDGGNSEGKQIIFRVIHGSEE